jgi:hypothetical protein
MCRFPRPRRMDVRACGGCARKKPKDYFIDVLFVDLLFSLLPSFPRSSAATQARSTTSFASTLGRKTTPSHFSRQLDLSIHRDSSRRRRMRCDQAADPIDIPNTTAAGASKHSAMTSSTRPSPPLCDDMVPFTWRSQKTGHYEPRRRTPEDGADGMVHLGTSIFWTDIAIASQDANATHSAMTKICNEKLRTNQPAAELNIDVLPVVFSHLGAFAAQCKKFEEKVRELKEHWGVGQQ